MPSVRRDSDKPNTSILGIPPEGSVIGVSSRNSFFWFKIRFFLQKFLPHLLLMTFQPQQYQQLPQFLQPPLNIQPGMPGKQAKHYFCELSLVIVQFQHVHLIDFVPRWFDGGQHKSCSVSRLECCTGTLSTRSVYTSLMSKLVLKAHLLFNTIGIRLHWDSGHGSATAGWRIPTVCRSSWCRSITELHLW